MLYPSILQPKHPGTRRAKFFWPEESKIRSVYLYFLSHAIGRILDKFGSSAKCNKNALRSLKSCILTSRRMIEALLQAGSSTILKSAKLTEGDNSCLFRSVQLLKLPIRSYHRANILGWTGVADVLGEQWMLLCKWSDQHKRSRSWNDLITEMWSRIAENVLCVTVHSGLWWWNCRYRC